MSKVCPVCRTRYPAGAAHCTRDGTALEAAPPDAVDEPHEEVTEERPPDYFKGPTLEQATEKVPTLTESQLIRLAGDDQAAITTDDEATADRAIPSEDRPGDADGDGVEDKSDGEGSVTRTHGYDDELTAPTTPQWARHRQPTEEATIAEDTSPDQAQTALVLAPDDLEPAALEPDALEPDALADDVGLDALGPAPDLANELEGPSGVLDILDRLAAIDPDSSPTIDVPSRSDSVTAESIEPASAPAISLVDRTDKSAIALVPSKQRRFGRYVLLCRFASGGMADLFLARIAGPAGFEKLVAIKRIHPHLTAQPGFLEMFLDEGRLAARISHPNVVDVIELGRVEDSYFIAMEYVAGQSLRSLLRRRRLSYGAAARIISHAASGLHAAHQLRDSKGELLHVVHRDVSPGNILISYDGTVKVADFGVARARGNLHTTAVGVVKGKFAYMAPEQAKAGAVDQRTDIFSLGVVLYEATTRRRLFRADSEQATLLKVVGESILPPSALDADYPLRLEQVVMRALERDPVGRYQTAEAMHEDLEAFIHESGDPVLTSTIGALMKETFAEQIREKQQVIRQAHERLGDPLPETAFEEVDSVSSSLSGGTAAARIATATSKRRGLYGIAAGLLGLSALALALLLLFVDRPANPETVHIVITAIPKNATIEIDGKRVSNPCDLVRRRTSSAATVAISAPGHVTRRIRLPLNRGGQLMVALDRKTTATIDSGPAARPDAAARPAAAPDARAADATSPARADAHISVPLRKVTDRKVTDRRVRDRKVRDRRGRDRRGRDHRRGRDRRVTDRKVTDRKVTDRKVTKPPEKKPPTKSKKLFSNPYEQ